MSCRDFFINLKQRIEELEETTNMFYYKCQWEKKDDSVSGMYLLYRWIHFIIISLILWISFFKDIEISANKWYIFFSNWSLIMDFIQAALGVFIATECRIRGGEAQTISRKYELFSLYGAFQSCAVSLSLSTTAIYWCWVHNPAKDKKNLVCTLVFIVMTAVMFFDMFMVSHPVKLFDILYPLLVSLVYLDFSIFYALFKGTNREGRPYVYETMRWNEPFLALESFFFYMLVLMITYIFVWCVSVILRAIGNKIDPSFPLEPHHEEIELH